MVTNMYPIVRVRKSFLMSNSNYSHYHQSKRLISIQNKQHLLSCFSGINEKLYNITDVLFLTILTGMFSKLS